MTPPAAPPPPRRPRIALTGSAGVGKTSLGLRLAAGLDLPFLAEGMRARLEAGLDLHTLDRAGYRALIGELFDEAQRAQARAVAEAGGFVADRCALDFAAFWLYYGLAFDDDATARLFERVRAGIADYDRIVVLPWGAVPLTADGIRSTNPWVQLHVQALIEGLLARMAPPGRVVHMPAEVEGLDRRAAWLTEQVLAGS